MNELLSNFLVVSNQVLILFILIAVGFICGKFKVINDTVSKGLGDIVMYISTPAVIISSFLRPFDSTMLKKLMLSFLIAIAFHAVGIAVSYIIRVKDINEQKVSRFSVIFSNAGYMSLPLQLALLGDTGSFYGSAYVVIFNIVVWTYGIILMGNKGEKLTVQKLVFNPGVIGVVIGLILFLFNASSYIPSPISGAVSNIAALNTPLPMFIIGFYLSKSKLISAFTEKRIYLPIFLRLVICPAFSLLFFYILKIDYTLSVAFIIASSAPVAAMASIFSAKYERDTALSVKMVSISTLFSILTMPIFVAIAQMVLK